MDIDLVIRAQHGDKGAYTLLATEVADRYLAVSRRILRDLNLAEDATQQALLAIWQDLPHLRDPARFEAWSYRILVHACYTEGRNQRRWSPDLRLLPLDESVVDDGLSSFVDRDQLERGFRRLSIDHRTVVVLHFYLDLPLDRVAEIVGIPSGTAHSRFHHAMRALRAALDADSRAEPREVIS
jgi:RNA polymerase sigma-70 factor (ECF subfamily)